jgi:hypothetical protein
MAFGWRNTDLGGGGGINAVASSSDGSVILSGGDISTMHRSLDAGATWENVNRGLYDGGQNGTVGGITFRDGSNTDALMGSNAGVWITDDADDTCTWTRISAATIEFGDGGGTRPRPGNGCMADSVGNYSFIVGKNGNVYRYNWATATYTAAVVSGSGTGDGYACDPSTADTGIMVTLSNVYRCTDMTGAGTITAFTGGPSNGRGCAFAELSNGSKYMIVANDAGVWRSASFTGVPAAGIAWTNITGSNMRAASDWTSVGAGDIGGGNLRILVGAGTPRVNANSTYESHFYTDNGQVTSPTWVNASKDDTNFALSRDAANKVVDIAGNVCWIYLPASQGGNIGNGCIASTTGSMHQAEDLIIEKGNPNRFWACGRQGVWLFDIAAETLYPAMGRLGVTANGQPVSDPNSDGHVYIMNTDHATIGTADGGVSWRRNNQGLDPNNVITHPAGFDFAVETGVSISHLFLTHGERNLSGGGGIYWSPDPMAFGDWTNVGFTAADAGAADPVPVGIAVRRATYNGTTRRVAVVAIEGGGFRRGVMTTANPPTVVAELTNITGGPTITYGGNGHAEWAPIVFLTDDHVVMWNRLSNNIYYCRNATTTGTPTCVNIKSDSSADVPGQGFMAKGADSDTMFFSFASGTNQGVWKATGWDAATASGDLTWTAISPPSGSWNRPGALDYTVVNGTGRLFVMDQVDRNNLVGSGSSGTPAKAYISTTAAGTTLSNISGTTFSQLTHKAYGACQTADGKIFVTGQGPGCWEYVDLASDPGGGGSGSDTVITDPGFEEATTAATTVHTVAFNAAGYASGTRVVVATWSGDGDGADVPIITDTIGTSGGWTTHGSVKINADGKAVALHSALLGGSAANGNIIATYADSQTGAGLACLKVVDDSGVAQTKTNSGSGGTATLTFTSALGSPRSSVIAVVLDKTASPAMTFPTGYTVSYESGFDAPSTGISMGYLVGTNEQSLSVSGVASGEWGIVAIELSNATTVGNADVSWVELEVPDVTAQTQVSWVELEVPEATGHADVSFVELEVPDAPVVTGNADVSWVELEVPNAPPGASGSHRQNHYWKQLARFIREGVYLRDPRPRP